MYAPATRDSLGGKTATRYVALAVENLVVERMNFVVVVRNVGAHLTVKGGSCLRLYSKANRSAAIQLSVLECYE